MIKHMKNWVKKIIKGKKIDVAAPWKKVQEVRKSKHFAEPRATCSHQL